MFRGKYHIYITCGGNLSLLVLMICPLHDRIKTLRARSIVLKGKVDGYKEITVKLYFALFVKTHMLDL